MKITKTLEINEKKKTLQTQAHQRTLYFLFPLISVMDR